MIEEELYDMFYFVFFMNLENEKIDILLIVFYFIERNFKLNDVYFLLNGCMLINEIEVFSVKVISFVIYYGYY